MEIMCTMCREVKDESEYYYYEKAHKYNCYCRVCQRLYTKEYMRIYRERERAKKLIKGGKL